MNKRNVFFNVNVNTTENINDPFAKLPLRQLLNMLSKAGIEIPKRSNKEDLLELARAHELIPSLKCCVDSNCTPKYSLLVLVCPFTSISKVVSDKIGTLASYLLSDRFDNLERIGEIHGPLLLIHGNDDSIIPCHHSKVLHSQAKKHDIVTDLQILEKCDHNTMDLRRIVQHIRRFFAWQFETARKKDALARLKSSRGTSVEKASKNEKEENKKTHLVKLNGQNTDQAEEKQKNSDTDLQYVRMDGVINAPNYGKTQIRQIQMPAYAYLHPNPTNSEPESVSDDLV